MPCAFVSNGLVMPMPDETFDLGSIANRLVHFERVCISRKGCKCRQEEAGRRILRRDLLQKHSQEMTKQRCVCDAVLLQVANQTWQSTK